MNEITEKLVQSAAQGKQDAIAQLYELTYNSVYKTVKAMIRDEDTVLDIMQDSYIKAFKSLDQLDKAESFTPWVKRIAANRAKDWLKKKKPILFSETADEDGNEPDYKEDRPEHLPEELIDRQETTRLINDILATLSDEQRLVIGLYYYEELSVKEIAELVGCSENTVKSRLNYGRKKIEAKVRQLESEGVKLYSMAPVGFLMWLFGQEAAAAVPSAPVLDAVTAQLGLAAGGAAAGVAGSAAKGGLKSALKNALKGGIKSVAAKAGAAVTAAAVTVAGAAAAIDALRSDNDYTSLLAMYEEAAADDFARWKADPEKYAALSSYTMEYAQFSTFRSTVYTLCDLDGNGTEELIIASYDPLGGWIYEHAVYTNDGRRAIPIVQSQKDELLTITEKGFIIISTLLDDGTEQYNVLQLDSDRPGLTHGDIYTADRYTGLFTRGDEHMDSEQFFRLTGRYISPELEWSVLIPSVDPVYRFDGPVTPANIGVTAEEIYIVVDDEPRYVTPNGFGHPRDMNGDGVFEMLIFDSEGIREVYTAGDDSRRLLWRSGGENTAQLYSDGSLLIGGQYFRLQEGSLEEAQPTPNARPVELSEDSCFIMLRTGS